MEKVNATRRRIVASFARAQEANRAKRRCGWSVDGRWSVREGGEEERFPKKRTEKTGNRGQTKSRFSYSASKGVETSQRNRGARSSLLFQARSILFLKKKKKIRKLFLTFDRKRSFDLRIVGSKMGRICERKKKEKKEGGR